jgi:hypothetical protein
MSQPPDPAPRRKRQRRKYAQLLQVEVWQRQAVPGSIQEVIFEGGGWTVPSSVEGTIFLPEVLMTMYMCMCMCVCAGLLSVSAGSP